MISGTRPSYANNQDQMPPFATPKRDYISGSNPVSHMPSQRRDELTALLRAAPVKPKRQSITLSR